MDLDYLWNAHQRTLATEARNIDFRRMYHELRRADRLQQALVSARRRGALDSLSSTPRDNPAAG